MNYKDYFDRFSMLEEFNRGSAVAEAMRSARESVERFAAFGEDYGSYLQEVRRSIAESLDVTPLYYRLNRDAGNIGSLAQRFQQDFGVAHRDFQRALGPDRGLLESWRESLSLDVRRMSDALSVVSQFRQFSASELLGRQIAEVNTLMSAQRDWMRRVDVSQLWQSRDVLASLTRDLLSLYSAEIVNLEEDQKDGIELAELEEDQVKLVRQMVAERFSPVLEQSGPSGAMKALRDILEYIKSNLVRLKPGVKILLVNLLFEILGNIIAPMVMSPFSVDNPRVSTAVHLKVKSIRRENRRIPKYIRVVVANQLFVRSGPGRRNKVVGQLYAGDVVVILERRTKSWSLVRYENSDGDLVVQGWVFSRYLESLNRR